MVRERVKNRNFRNVFLIPFPSTREEAGIQLPFDNPQPLEVDIGCGRGRFLLAKARINPGINFLGIDRSLLRLQKIDSKALASGLNNIRLVNTDALRYLPDMPPASVSTFYVFFPDPWPKRRHHSKRLISQAFTEIVFQTLAPSGTIHLCTDHAEYFDAMLRCWNASKHFRQVAPFLPTEEEETDFALLFKAQNLPTHRCSYQKMEPCNESVKGHGARHDHLVDHLVHDKAEVGS